MKNISNFVIFGLALIIGIVFLTKEKKAEHSSMNQNVNESTKVINNSLLMNLFGGSDTKSASLPNKTSEWTALLKEINDLHFKVIRTQKDQDRTMEIFSSKKNIDNAVSRISTLDGKDLKNNQKLRMDGVLFFLRCLEMKNNPAREYVEEQISKLILDSSIESIEDVELKKSVIADRIELFVTLKEQSPGVAFALQEKINSSFQKKFMQFAINFYNLDKKEN